MTSFSPNLISNVTSPGNLWPQLSLEENNAVGYNNALILAGILGVSG